MTILADDDSQEMLLIWNPDTTPTDAIVAAHTKAADAGYAYVADNWYDVTNELHVSVLRKADA